MRKIFLAISLLFVGANIRAEEQKYEWTFSYQMGITKLNMNINSDEKEILIKDRVKSLLHAKETYCTNSSNSKKEIRKYFNGCDISYLTKDNTVKADVSCNNLEYSIEMPQQSNEENNYIGKISLETKTTEFNLNSEGKIYLKRGKTCN